MGRAVLHIGDPGHGAVLHAPVDQPKRRGEDQAVRHAPLGQPVAVHGQMEAVRRLCDVERAVHLRQVFLGVVFVQDEGARQREEVGRAGGKLDHDDRRGVFALGQRRLDPFAGGGVKVVQCPALLHGMVEEFARPADACGAEGAGRHAVGDDVFPALDRAAVLPDGGLVDLRGIMPGGQYAVGHMRIGRLRRGRLGRRLVRPGCRDG